MNEGAGLVELVTLTVTVWRSNIDFRYMQPVKKALFDQFIIEMFSK
jgi:hypothetical protein